MKPDHEIHYRTMELDRGLANAETRTIPASLSSETVVKRSFGDEVLSHDPAHIDLSRASDGLPMLFSHDHESFIGRVQNVRVDDGVLRGDLQFSENPKASEVFADVQSGMLRDMSIGYRINEAEETDTGYRAVNWSLLEASVVAVPADTTVGINRSEETEMTDTTETPNNGETHKGDSVVVDIQLASQRAAERGAEAGIKAERKRVSDIQSIFALHAGDDIQTLGTRCIDDGLTVEASQRNLLSMLSGQAVPLASGDFKQTGNRGDIQMGETSMEKTLKGMQDALYKRGGVDEDIDVSTNEFMGMTLSGMAREYLRIKGTDMRGMDQYGIVGKAFQRDVTETPFDKVVADFPALLADVANKSLLKGYNESEETWMRWCATGSLPDFKTGNRPNLSLYPTPATVAENGAFQLADMTDWSETISLKTVGSIFSITRQALINDDLASFTRIPRAQGRAAARSVGDTVYEQLTTVITMGDTNELFDAINHVNVYTAGAPSVATVDLIRTGMALQEDPSGQALGIRPAYLLCPLALEGVATTLRNAQFDPDTAEASGNTAGNRPNWVAGTFEVVPEYRLDASSATQWYMTASQSIYDTVEVDFLNGVNAPMLESRDGFKIDGVEMKVRLDYGVAPLDWRTIALNGAAPV